jgi:murein L,D-transpeptidase YafK
MMKKNLSIYVFALSCLFLNACAPNQLSTQSRINNVKIQRLSGVKTELKSKGFILGNKVFMRIHKQEAVLELFIFKNDKYEIFNTYPICKFSGNLGPKQKEGDKQAPEGLYWVKKEQLNPNSDYHLAFNLGYPNSYDLSLGRTGSYLMVHGNCVSIGCYAMTDKAIEEIYIIAEAALKNGQKEFGVLALPFKMNSENLEANKNNQWSNFWQELQKIDAYFSKSYNVPKVNANNGHYEIIE